jgi:cytoskeleton protein RodZ
MNKESEINIGAELKRLRLEKDLTLEEVCKQTKIHLNTLKNLEEGQLIDMNPVYVKGFIKIYCRLLGTDSAPFIQTYDKVKIIPHSQLKSPPESLISGLKLKMSLIRPPSFNILKKVLIIILCLLVIWGASKLFRKPGARPAQKQSPTVGVESKKTLSSQAIKVTVRAKQDCWIKSTVDGKVIYQTILKKGRFKSWTAKKQIELSLGNAGGIELEINGKLFSPLGRSGQVIKRVLINKDGLKILK